MYIDMQEGSDGERGPSVLVIAELGAEERGLAEALAARGLRVRACACAMEGVRAARDGADVVVLGLPLGDVDPIAVCAALKEVPYPPTVVLGDHLDQAA